MIQTNKFLFVAALFTAIWEQMPLAVAQSAPVNLVCRGDSVFDTDGRKSTTPVTIDVSIDLVGKTAVLTGDSWGCLADLANSGNPQAPGLCSGRLPVEISEAQVRFFLEANGDSYATRSSFQLNRNSGHLFANSIAVSLPPSKATWNLLSIKGSLVCVLQRKLF